MRKLGKPNLVAPSPCPGCGEILNGASFVGEGADASPNPGDITVCIGCGEIIAFADDLTLRGLTDEEMIEIAADPDILAIQRARAAWRQWKKDKDQGPSQ